MNLKDIKIDQIKCKGPGGQHINKNATGCMATHIPTGITVTVCGRHFHKNKKKALKKLDSKLKEEKRAEVAAKKKNRRDYKIHNTQTIRTYHHKRGTVKDHRSGKTANLDEFMDGEVDLFDFSEIS